MRDFLAMSVLALQAAERQVYESIRRNDKAHLIELREAIKQYANKALKIHLHAPKNRDFGTT